VCDGGDLDCGSGLLLIIRSAMAPLRPAARCWSSREISVREDLPAWCRMVGHGIAARDDRATTATTHFLLRKKVRDDQDLARPRAGARPGWQVRARWTSGMQAKVTVRNHGFEIGQPASFDTEDAAPSAIEFLLSAVAGCAVHRHAVAAVAARRRGAQPRGRGQGEVHNSLVFLGVEHTGSPASSPASTCRSTSTADVDEDQLEQTCGRDAAALPRDGQSRLQTVASRRAARAKCDRCQPAPDPPFPVSVVGSWPRPRWLLDATQKRQKDLEHTARPGDVARASSCRRTPASTSSATASSGATTSTSFLSEKLDGTALMSMADLLDFVEDKAGFEALLQTLDVPAYAIKNPTITGRLAAPRVRWRCARRRSCAAHDARLQGDAAGPVPAVALDVGQKPCRPPRIRRATSCATTSCDPARRAAGSRGARCRGRAVRRAGADRAGVRRQGATRTFMCAALAAAADPAAELALAVDLINRVVDGVTKAPPAMHVCRGNWSRKEDVLLSGDYDPLLPYLAQMRVDQFVLEYATPRAGPESLLAQLPNGSTVGFGAINPRTDPDEDPVAIADRVAGLVQTLGHRRIWLNPDCGFGTFADRPVASEAAAVRKMEILAAAAQRLRSSS
jgi:5-methyltetrahydropteroyltriglutamate--homocysteine methyltransferase